MIPPTRKMVVDEARSHLNTRWLHQGRAPGKGLDCLGLIIVTATGLGYTVRDQRDYAMNPDSVRLIRECREQLDEIPIEEATTGDVLVFCFTKSRRPFHFSIKTSPTTMIHAHTLDRKVIEHTIGDYWTKQIVTAFRFPGVTA